MFRGHLVSYIRHVYLKKEVKLTKITANAWLMTQKTQFNDFTDMLNDTTWHKWWDESESMAAGNRLFKQYLSDGAGERVEIGVEFDSNGNLTYLLVWHVTGYYRYNELYKAGWEKIDLKAAKEAIMALPRN